MSPSHVDSATVSNNLATTSNDVVRVACVTGASGYLAAHLVQQLLEKGQL